MTAPAPTGLPHLREKRAGGHAERDRGVQTPVRVGQMELSRQRNPAQRTPAR